ncbi:MAG: LLM class flavin-dependent oxidoreductase [Sphingobium sp.]
MSSAVAGDLEIVGIVNHRAGAVGDPLSPLDFDPEHIRASAQSQEAAGYDRVLIANAATMPESFAIGAYLSPITTRLGFMMAHRPGPVMPTMAARHLATLDRLSQGRAAVHVIAGADDREVQADGGFTSKEERYHLAAEYVDVMRRMWSSPEPFDFKGEFYTFNGAHAMVRPTGGAMPVYWGGTSDLALDLAGKCADVYAMGGDSFAGAGELSQKALAAAQRHGRDLKVLMTMVIIVGETEDAAWDRANTLYQTVMEQVAGGARGVMANHEKDGDKAAAGAFQRMLERTKEGDRLDRCLWTGLNKAYGGRGNNSVLVGTAAQIADSLMEYRRLGITRFLLRGPDQDRDGPIIGRDLVPELRRLIVERESAEATSLGTQA